MTRTMLHLLLAVLMIAVLAAPPLRADTAAEIEQAIANIRKQRQEVDAGLKARRDEIWVIEAFRRQVWADWLTEWNANRDQISKLKTQIELDQADLGAASNQNSRDRNDRMRALLAERDRLARLDGQSVDDCVPPCTTMQQLIAYHNERVDRLQVLQKETAELKEKQARLDRALAAEERKRAASQQARRDAMAQQSERLQALRAEYAELLKDPDKFLLPSLDGRGPPRLLTREEFDLEVTVAWFEIGRNANPDSPEFRAEVEALVRKMLGSSNDMRQRIADYVKLLDDQIAALDRRVDGGATAVAGENCPARNPDPAARTLSHRIPPGDDKDYLACAYFADPGGAPGPIKSQVRYAEGKETGVAAYFTLDGGHHLDQIHNVHGARPSGSDCSYISASALKSYRWIGDDGSEMSVFCKPDGTVGRCDYTAHDGRSRRCSADCSKDACADLRQKIGWPAMQ